MKTEHAPKTKQQTGPIIKGKTPESQNPKRRGGPIFRPSTGRLATIVALLLATAAAEAATSFSDPLTEANANFTYSQFTSGNPSFSPDGATWVSGGFTRDYIRTADTNYASTGFVARIEFVLPPAVGDWGIVFFGIGTGDNDGDIFYQSPDAGLLDHPSAALCVWPGVAGGRFACLTNNDVGGTNSYSFFVAGPFSTTNTPGLPDAAQTNSITLRWNPKIKLLSMDCDVNMDSSVDGSAARVIPQEILGAWNTNASSIYYGAGNGVTIRNFSVTLTNFPAPPPTLGIAMHAGITVSGTVGLHYQVQYRTALDPTNSWTLLQDIPVLSTPSVLVYDPAPASSPQRLYQVVQVP